jgi:spermidine synthase
MSASLFVERHGAGIAFYINGNLQFDTADEAIYHEYLVVPAIALAIQRFPNSPLRVLVCGGGDGLAVRDILRFTQVRDVTVVDYDPEVLALARTEFATYNGGSLLADASAPLGAQSVAVYTQDAFEFVQQLPDACYHVVIGDFTCPTRPEDMTVFSLEWFTQVRRVLGSQGIFALNGVSPNKTPTAYWCLYQTLIAAGFCPKPMRLFIPSFQRLGYGDWGFFLAAAELIRQTDLEQIQFPENLQALTLPNLQIAFRFPEAIATLRQGLKLNTLNHRHLFYYLLNPPEISQETSEEMVDFLEICETGTGQYSTTDEMQLEMIAQRWLTLTCNPNSDNTEQTELKHFQSLIPVQHYHQKPEMMQEWLSYLKTLMAEIDPKVFSEQLLARSQALPPKLAQDLKQFAITLRTGQPLTQLSTHTTELITVLVVTLLMANIATPDAAFAKGFSGGSSSHSGGFHSSGGSSGYYGGGYSGDGGGFGWLGFWMMAIGGFWLYQLYQNPDHE